MRSQHFDRRLYLAHEDGASPTPLSVSRAPGESGVSVLRLRFPGDAYYGATLRQHFIRFQMSPQVRLERPLVWGAVRRDVTVGSLAIYPAGIECGVEVKESVDALIVAIDPDRLALAAAESSALGARLTERLSGYDEALFDLAHNLALEGAADYPNGAHYWNDVASSFIDGLVTRHTSALAKAPRGMLSKTALDRLTEYIFAHIDEQIEVAALAKIAGRSPFHFCRVFSRSVGMSPHRYVVHLRLQRAIELVRDGRFGFAEIAASTGFSDQSHLSRWVRRVHGVSLKQLVRPPIGDQNSKNLHDPSLSPR
jgi:AraC family transcriptional regulator